MLGFIEINIYRCRKCTTIKLWIDLANINTPMLPTQGRPTLPPRLTSIYILILRLNSATHLSSMLTVKVSMMVSEHLLLGV